MVPVASAASIVWQLPQPASAKTFAPGEFVAELGASVVAVPAAAGKAEENDPDDERGPDACESARATLKPRLSA